MPLCRLFFAERQGHHTHPDDPAQGRILPKTEGKTIPNAWDICCRHTDIFLCLTPVRYADMIKSVIAMSINDILSQTEMAQFAIEQSYEYGLPNYLQHDLDAYKDGLKNGSTLMDCLWGELYGSINIAEINEGAITPEHADYLRKKFLWR